MAHFCAKHPRAHAGWQCTWCHKPLCAECTASRDAHDRGRFLVCCLCTGPAQPLTQERTQRSFFERVKVSWKFPLSSAGLGFMFAAGVVIWLFDKLQWPAVGVAILWSYVFSLIRAVANGHGRIDVPDFTSMAELSGPARRGALALAVIWVPAVAYLWFWRPGPTLVEEPIPAEEIAAMKAEQQKALEEYRLQHPELAPPEGVDPDLAPHELDQAQAAPDEPAAPPPKLTRMVEKPPKPLHKDPVLWLLVLAGIFYAPMAMLVAAAGGDWLSMMNPVHIVGYIFVAGREYVSLVLSTLALGVGYVVMGYVGKGVNALPPPVVSGIAAATISTYVPFVMGHVYGTFLYMYGTSLGCLPPEEAFEPVLPGAVPKGALPETLAPAPPSAPGPAPAVSAVATRAASIEVDGWGAGGDAGGQPAGAPANPEAPPAQAFARPAEVEVEGWGENAVITGSAPAVAEGNWEMLQPAAQVQQAARAATPEEQITAAVQAQDLDQAVALYRAAAQLAPAALAPDAHFRIAQAAAARGDYPLALKGFYAVGQAEPDGALAPKAFVVMARIQAERLNNPAAAEKIYRYVLQRYPGTEAAKFAQGRLAPPTA